MALIEAGAKAPLFTLADQDGGVHALRDYAGRAVVLYFYPRDDTPGCTAEACAFRDLLPKFSGLDAAVLGVSPDSEQSHERFARKHGLPFTLLSDPPPEEGGTPPTCDAYGVWQEKTMHGRTSMGVARTTYLIDPGGVVVRRWDRVRVEGHAAEVLEALRARCRASA